MVKVLTEAFIQQSLRAVVNNPADNSPCLMVTYTGQVLANHFTGGDRADLQIQFPVTDFHFFAQNNQQTTISDVMEPKNLLVATASAAITEFVDKGEPCLGVVVETRANLRRITLKPGGQKIAAVVFEARLSGQNSEIHRITYNVSALLRSLKENRIELGSTWDGSYILDGNGGVGDILQFGSPQRSKM